MDQQQIDPSQNLYPQGFVPQGTKIDLPNKFDPETGNTVSFYLPQSMTAEQVQEFANKINAKK